MSEIIVKQPYTSGTKEKKIINNTVFILANIMKGLSLSNFHYLNSNKNSFLKYDVDSSIRSLVSLKNSNQYLFCFFFLIFPWLIDTYVISNKEFIELRNYFYK